MDEDVLGMLISLVWIIPFVVIIAVAEKEKRKKQQQKQRQPLQSTARSAAQPKQTPPKQTQRAMAQAGEGEDPCHEEQLRPERPGMKLVTPQTLEGAGEGEDPCHVVERPDTQTDSAYDVPARAEVDAHRLAEQVLSGVIMSEVLKRPAERRLQQRMRRGL